jgi:6-phosphogluconolactonase
MSNPTLQVVPPTDLAAVAADRFVAAARDAIADHGSFTVALSGGSTPKAMHAILAQEPRQSAIDWSKVEIYFGDERCVPPDDPESNYRMASETLLSKVPIPPANVHRMRGEIDPQQAATEYGRMLKARFGDDGGLDLVLLGMGDDGHTLSLFPGTAAVSETHHRVVANYAEHSTTGKSWRITMTAPFVNRAKEVIVLVAGAAKRDRLSQVLRGARDPQKMPIQLIAPKSGQMLWLADTNAAPPDA